MFAVSVLRQNTGIVTYRRSGGGGGPCISQEHDFSSQIWLDHRVQRAQEPPGKILLKDRQVIWSLEKSIFGWGSMAVVVNFGTWFLEQIPARPTCSGGSIPSRTSPTWSQTSHMKAKQINLWVGHHGTGGQLWNMIFRAKSGSTNVFRWSNNL